MLGQGTLSRLQLILDKLCWGMVLSGGYNLILDKLVCWSKVRISSICRRNRNIDLCGGSRIAVGTDGLITLLHVCVQWIQWGQMETVSVADLTPYSLAYGSKSRTLDEQFDGARRPKEMSLTLLLALHVCHSYYSWHENYQANSTISSDGSLMVLLPEEWVIKSS